MTSDQLTLAFDDRHRGQAAEIGEPPGCWITIEPVQEVAA